MPNQAPLSEQAVAFLTQECDRLLSLYTQTQEIAQSVFNFYLTFVSAVIGGVILLLQADVANTRDKYLMLAALLFFAATVGSVYSSALSGRYARSRRYASAVDELRRYLITSLNVPVPRLYDSFLKPAAQKQSIAQKSWRGFIWLFPTGTYQMFIALVNSMALAGMALMLALAAKADFATTLWAAFVIFILAFGIYNFYSHLVIQRLGGQKVNIEIGSDAPAWAARE